MAKKSRNSIRSTRKHKKVGSGGDAAWKHSPIVGGALGVVILLCLIMVIRTLTGSGGGGSILPDTFPHAYLAEEDNGKYDAILIKRGSKSVPTPFTENGKEYWEAYICHNANCPGRAQGKKGKESPPYIFAGKRPKMPEPPANGENGQGPSMPDMSMMQIFCPKCKAAYDKASAKKKATFDLTAVEHYQTEEAQQELEKIRAEYRKRSGGS
ncbi:MAG: hypothetical protein J6333_00920 [Planctomycetes bacterium]|nr:hypothetical protein [Planctomycetota bacterium]